jgi:peptide deformylase
MEKYKMIITDKNMINKECKSVSLIEAQDIIFKLEAELDKNKSGVGLSANQIGVDAKVAILRVGGKQIELVNPVIVDKYDEMEFYGEGCLSFPGQFVKTRRFNEVHVKDLLHPAGIVATGFEAVALQHEIGHVLGETMFDYEIKIPGRNEKCWCSSGKKYKKCHLGKTIT